MKFFFPLGALLIVALGCIAASAAGESILPQLKPYSGPSRNDVDVTTIKGKVLCGYQGWFRTPNDGVANHWVHWSGDQTRVAPNTLTVDMWPDMSEYPASFRSPASDMKHKDGSQAYLFSSCNPKVVDLHFKWMRDYGIDGVFVQRFLGSAENSNTLNSTAPLAYSRNSANKYGRVFAVTYDMSGADPDKIYGTIVSDWKFLVDKMRLTRDKRYLHHNGKPVLEIYGFFPDRFGPDVANKVIDFFKKDPKYGAFLIGAGTWEWQKVTAPGWPEVYRRFDAIQPWNVGAYELSKSGDKVAATGYWAGNIEECRKHGMLYQAVVYPGFSWDNLQTRRREWDRVGKPILRRGGDFMWEQFVAATKLKVDTIFVAMFDEVDEGTAIFKVTNDPPDGAHFVTLDGKPSDWYLRLTGAGTKMFRGETPLTEKLPIR